MKIAIKLGLALLIPFTIIGLQAFNNKQDSTSDWPESSRKAIDAMTKKYGTPNESTSSMMVWLSKPPYKRIVVYREEVQHNFPMPHKDVVEHFVDYKVPVDKFDEIAMYDGSVICERTKGEISARCDQESMNILALNLANDVAKGTKDVKAARDFYARTAVAFTKGNLQPYAQSLQFEPSGGTGDPDNMSDAIDASEKLEIMKNKTKETSLDGK